MSTHASPAKLHGLKILLAEDHMVNATLLIEELEHLGAHVEHTLDGDLTCKLLMSGEKFDVILMDCQMPNMDGFEAARRIRAWELQQGRPAVPIIALTGLSQEFEYGHSCQAGMNGYLVKPCSDLQVAAAIQVLVKSPFGRGTEALTQSEERAPT